MRQQPRSFLTAILVGALLAVVSTSTGGAATDKTAMVVVTKSGLNLGGQGSDYAEYGIVLRNRSTSVDALNVTVTVKALDSHGRVFTADDKVVTLIPAATNFVIDGQLIWGVSINLARIKTVVSVGKTAPRGRSLPRVTHVALNAYGNITASLTNTYKRPLPDSATIYGVFLDTKGRVVGAGDQTTDAILQPGETVSVDLFGNVPGAKRGTVASAQLSVDPCGLAAFTPDCPVLGAG